MLNTPIMVDDGSKRYRKFSTIHSTGMNLASDLLPSGIT
jgi:hypothetical protein